MSVKMYDGQPFDALVQNGITVVDSFAEWCGPCKMIAPIFSKLAGEMSDVQFVKIDTDKHSAIARHFGITSIPTLMIFKNGELVANRMGFMPEPMLRNWIQSVM